MLVMRDVTFVGEEVTLGERSRSWHRMGAA